MKKNNDCRNYDFEGDARKVDQALVKRENELAENFTPEVPDIIKPNFNVLVKLGSIAVHSEEMLSSGGHEFDRVALESLLQDKDVIAWLGQMDTLALIPKKR